MMLQEAVAAAATHASSSADGELTWSAVLAWLTAKVVEFCKVRGWFGAIDGQVVNRIVSWLAALAVSLGLAWTYDSTTGDWALSGNLSAMMQGSAHFLRQLMFQEIAYKQFIRPDTERRAAEATGTGKG